MAVHSYGHVQTHVHYLTAQDIKVILLRTAIRERTDQENLVTDIKCSVVMQSSVWP